MAASLDDTVLATRPVYLPAMAGDLRTRDALLRLAHDISSLMRLSTAAAAARRAGGGGRSASLPPPPSSLEAALGTTRRLVRLATLSTLFTPPPRSRPGWTWWRASARRHPAARPTADGWGWAGEGA